MQVNQNHHGGDESDGYVQLDQSAAVESRENEYVRFVFTGQVEENPRCESEETQT